MTMPPGLGGTWKSLFGRKKKPKASVQEYPYVWNRARKPDDHLGKPCKIIGWENRSQNLVVIEFAGEPTTYIVQKTGLQRRTPGK